jgi:hypothetical protein
VAVSRKNKRGSAAPAKKHAPKRAKTAASKKMTPPTPKRARRLAPAPPRPAVAPAQAVRAARLAQRMPLVHYPATTPFAAWSTWPDGLMSHAARGVPIAPGNFEQLRGTHVFFYAGPCCYYRHGCVGDAVLYFDPSVEEDQDGEATPFDSGALEDPTPRLRPWAQAPVAERWSFLQEHARPIDGWRSRFEAWLSTSYSDPERYLETSANRWEAGQPDRLTDPAGAPRAQRQARLRAVRHELRGPPRLDLGDPHRRSRALLAGARIACARPATAEGVRRGDANALDVGVRPGGHDAAPGGRTVPRHALC